MNQAVLRTGYERRAGDRSWNKSTSGSSAQNIRKTRSKSISKRRKLVPSFQYGKDGLNRIMSLSGSRSLKACRSESRSWGARDLF